MVPTCPTVRMTVLAERGQDRNTWRFSLEERTATIPQGIGECLDPGHPHRRRDRGLPGESPDDPGKDEGPGEPDQDRALADTRECALRRSSPPGARLPQGRVS